MYMRPITLKLWAECGRSISQRVVAALRIQNSSCRRPAEKENKQPVVDDEEAAIVRLIFTLYLRNYPVIGSRNNPASADGSSTHHEEFGFEIRDLGLFPAQFRSNLRSIVV